MGQIYIRISINSGMDWVTRIQKSLLVLLMFAQLDMFIGSILDLEDFGSLYLIRIDQSQESTNNYGNVSTHEATGYMQIDYEQRHAFGYTGWSLDTADVNLNPQYQDSAMQENPHFIDLFGVFFTAVTGNFKFMFSLKSITGNIILDCEYIIDFVLQIKVLLPVRTCLVI